MPVCLALRDLLPTAGDRQKGRDFCADIRERAQSLDGLTRVVDLSISSVIAEAAMNRRQLRTTLGRAQKLIDRISRDAAEQVPRFFDRIEFATDHDLSITVQ